MLTAIIEQLIAGEDLSKAQIDAALSELLSDADEVQVGAFLSLLSAKGESTEEVLALVHGMQNLMVTVPDVGPVLDIVGTGGDGFNTFNISTGSALLAAACGVKVAKHGNRSVSSLCGSADVLEALGFDVELGPKRVKAQIEQLGFGFCYAPIFHPAMGKLKALRKRLAVPSVFNILGPLLNPGGAEFLLLGVADKNRLDLMANVLAKANIKRAMVFHTEGLDELCPVGPAELLDVKDGQCQRQSFDPLDYGFKRCSVEDLKGGDALYNAEALRTALAGEKSALADTLVLNAGMALYVYGAVESLEAGFEKARAALDQQLGLALIDKIVSMPVDPLGEAS